METFRKPMNMNNPVVYTIGHSTRPLDEFVAMLNAFDVDTVIDVRTVPRSRTNPQYNLDTLPETLAGFAIGHLQIPALGGLRKKSKTVPDETNGFWANRSFHNYADHALSQEFSAGLEQLVALSETRRCVVMCAEAVWWRCHRRIIADYLLLRNIEVIHIMGPGKSTQAAMNPAANIQGQVLTYPSPQSADSDVSPRPQPPHRLNRSSHSS